MSVSIDLGIEEEVVLLDDRFEPRGSMPKAEAHTGDTPLHLAFSLFLFDGKGRFLVQRRALSKQTWAGVWSNSCCGHPAPGESVKDAVYRRTRYELGIELGEIECVLCDFRYRACWKGIWENEFCPVWIGLLDRTPDAFEESEIAEVAWESWDAFSRASERADGGAYHYFSPWSLMEARQLKGHPRVLAKMREWSRSNVNHNTAAKGNEDAV